MISDYDRIWVEISAEQYRAVYDGMGGDGAWSLHSCWTAPKVHDERAPGEWASDQETVWSLAGRCEAVLKNRTREGAHSYFLAVASEREA